MKTNLRKIILIPALMMVCISSFFSCAGDDRWAEYAGQTALGSWMYDVLQENYLWYESLPSYSKVNLFAVPTTILSNVKSSKDSYSFVDSLLDTPLPSYGFDYSLVRNPDNDTAYNALITYVIPGSPAAAVMKRGDWIVKVDTSYISKKYESKLLQGTRATQLTLGKYKEVVLNNDEEEGESTVVYRVVPNADPVQMAAAVSLTDNPIHVKKTISLNDGSRVGYLMYNGFVAGTKSEPEKYNNELRQWSAELAEQNINRVILDLRHNKGGSMDCVQLLSTILAPSFYLGETMAHLEYNAKHTAKNTTLTFDANLLSTSGKNLDTKTLIVLMSSETAGASEMLMHCLNNKIQAVMAIGASSKGQNVATEQFVNEELRWTFNPVVCTIYNSENETYGGFSPTYAVTSSTDYLHFLPFGDVEESLLSVALGVLNGTYPGTTGRSSRSVSTPLKIEKSVSSPASRRFTNGSGLRIH